MAKEIRPLAHDLGKSFGPFANFDGVRKRTRQGDIGSREVEGRSTAGACREPLGGLGLADRAVPFRGV